MTSSAPELRGTQVRDSGLVVTTVSSPAELQTALLRVLIAPPNPEQTKSMPASDVALVERALAQHLQAGGHCPAQLTGRHDELADLADFCRGTEQYAWWQGAPYTGKSAFAAWVVQKPPAGVDVVSFFVAGGFPDEANSDGYVTALSAQLHLRYNAKLEAGEGAGGRRHRLNDRLAATAQRLAAEQRSLLVVIDGLSEDRSAESGLQSIASLLPRHPPERTRFLITSRPLLKIPDDVPEQHPLRACTVRTLAPSRHVGQVGPRADLEVAQFAGDNPLRRRVLGLVAVAGRLALSELDELTEAASGAVDTALRSGLGHCLVHTADRPSLPTQEPGLALAHDALRDAVLRLHRRGVGELQELITRWAESYRAASWPGDTPGYLLTDYPSFLAGIGHVEKLVACVADSTRHDWMLAAMGSDVAALAEIEQVCAVVSDRLTDPTQWAALLAERERVTVRSGLMTRNDIANHLHITWSRELDRIIDMLPPPVDLRAGRLAWHRSDVERLTSLPVRRPEVRTGRAGALGAVRPPLERVVDECIDFKESRVHVRVWEGRAEEGERIVVVLGALHGRPNYTVSWAEELAGVVDVRFLDGRGGAATWFDYDMSDGKHEIDNLILETPSRGSRRGRSGGSDIAQRFVDNSAEWARSSIPELERAVGARVECYPEPAYTEETILEWQRGLGEQVVVENDNASLRGLVAAITRLEDVAPDDPRAALAEAACVELANEIDTRCKDIAVQRWDDGTKPRYAPAHSKWPRLFAARLAPARLGSRDEERVARHRRERVWPWPEADLAHRRELLDGLLAWGDDVGEHGDHPDDELYEAISRASGVLRHRIFVAQGDVQAAPPGERTSRVWGPLEIASDLDEWYRRTLRFPPDDSRRDARSTAHRALRDLFSTRCADHLWFGRDPQGRAVAYDPGSKVCGGRRFAVDWPHQPPPDGIPAGTYIVSGGERGDRPAYLKLPATDTLDLLPRPPGSLGEWNFGYSGGGPGALAHAICRLLEIVDGVEHDVFPWRWVDEQVSTSERPLRISVDEIRSRYPTKST